MIVTIQDAIRVLHLPENHLRNYDEYGIFIDDDLKAAISMAITALQEKAERENPKPLTIEELRQMHGEPVWLVDAKRWGIIDIEEYGQWEGVPFVCFFDRGIYHAWHIERRSIRCLRHKPKEVE